MTTILSAHPLPSPNGPQAIDLTALIEDAISQVHGSDERRLLSEWLSRLTGPQVVRLDLARYLQSAHSPNPCSKKENPMTALIQLGQAERTRLNAQALAVKQQTDASNRKTAAIIKAAHHPICQALADETGLTPDDFEPVVTIDINYAAHPHVLLNKKDEPVTLANAAITLTLPEHNAIYATFEIDQEADTYHRHSKRYSIENCDDLSNQYGESCVTLSHAIMIAADRWQAEEKYRQREDARQRELEQIELADRQREQTERETLLAALSDDPITLAILKLHAAIQSDRAHYRQSIEDLDLHLEQAAQRTHNRAQALERELKTALDELENQRQQTWAARDELVRRVL